MMGRLSGQEPLFFGSRLEAHVPVKRHQESIQGRH